jgi:hypothetical protein
MILGQPSVRLLIDAYSTGRFEDDHGFVFQANRGTLPTVVNSGGSVAMATLAGLGGNATVILRNLRAQPSSGSVTVTATGWNLNGNSAKSWTARTSAAANVQFTVGDLTPGTAYFVNDGTGGRGKGKGKGGGGTTGGVGVFTANGSGTITFTHQPGTAGKTYTVVPNGTITSFPSTRFRWGRLRRCGPTSRSRIVLTSMRRTRWRPFTAGCICCCTSKSSNRFRLEGTPRRSALRWDGARRCTGPFLSNRTRVPNRAVPAGAATRPLQPFPTQQGKGIVHDRSGDH